jgi:hypothetical protein
MVVGIAGEVEAVGIGKLGGVAVGGVHYHVNWRRVRDADATDFAILSGEPNNAMNRRVVTLSLFHRSRGQGRIALDHCELLEIRQQVENSGGNHVGGGGHRAPD